MGIYLKCSNSRMHSVYKPFHQRSHTQQKHQNPTYHAERIYHNRIDMWALVLIRDLRDLVHNMRPQSKFLDPVHDTRLILQCIHKQDRPLAEGRHFAERALHGTLTDLGSDCKVELASFGDLTLDPHVSLHERNEAFRNG